MLRTRAPEVSLWEAVLPEEVLRLPEELARVDALLDDPVFFAPFAPFFDPRVGRPSTPMEVYLRLMFLKFRYRLGYDSLCREVADSITWRRFCRIPLDGRVPHPTTLMKLTTRCGTAAVEGCNEALLAKAAEAKLLRTTPAARGHHGRARGRGLPDRLRAAGQGGSADRRGRAADPGCRGAVRTRLRDRSRSAGARARAIGAKLRLRARRPGTRPRPRCAGQVNDRARRSGQIRPESRHGAATKPGGPPPGSTATTLTDQPPRTGRHRTLRWPGSAPGDSGRGGRSCSARCGRRVLLRGIRGEDPAEVPLAEDQHPVGELGSDGQHDAFGEAVRPRTARRNLDYLDVRIRQHRVERRRELTGPIPDEEPEPGNTLAEVHHEVAGLLGRPRPVRCPVTPRTCR